MHLTHESHYQLANRAAFTWKLASLGIPTVLVYLGFTGDSGIVDAGDPFTDEAAWRAEVQRYSGGVVPSELFEAPIETDGARAWVLVRARPVTEVSPPRA